MTAKTRTWGRLYAGTRNHRKIKILAHRHPMLWMAWYVLLDIAIEIDDDGWIYVSPDQPYTDKELAKELRIRREDHVKELCKSLEDLGMIARSTRGIQVLSYSERNFDSDSSTPRVQKYRERKKDETLPERFCNGHETKSETPQIRTEQIREEHIKDIIASSPSAIPKVKKIIDPVFYNGTYFDLTQSQYQKLRDKANGMKDEDFKNFLNSLDLYIPNNPTKYDRRADGRLKNPANILSRWLDNQIIRRVNEQQNQKIYDSCINHPDKRGVKTILGQWYCRQCADQIDKQDFGEADKVIGGLTAKLSM